MLTLAVDRSRLDSRPLGCRPTADLIHPLSLLCGCYVARDTKNIPPREDEDADAAPRDEATALALGEDAEEFGIEGYLARASRVADGFAARDREPGTLEVYRWAWERFVAWCQRLCLAPLPAAPETVRQFLSVAATQGIEPARPRRDTQKPKLPRPVNYSGLRVYLAAINLAHKRARCPKPTSPDLDRTLDGLRRDIKVSHAPRKVAALTQPQLLAVLAAMPESLIGLRDRALVHVTYSSGRRRSETLGMDVEHLVPVPEGFRWSIPESKTNKTGAEDIKPITGAAASALVAWLQASQIVVGPVFRPVSRSGKLGATRLEGRDFAEMIKRSVQRIGLDPKLYSGHTLRASLITNAFRRKKPVPVVEIQQLTGHKSVQVLYEYVRDAELFKQNEATAMLNELNDAE